MLEWSRICGWGSAWRPMNTRATTFSATYASKARAWSFFTTINTIKGTYKDTSHGKPGRPSVFLPARRQWRVMTSHSASQGSSFELKQWVAVLHIDRDRFASCACAWTDSRRTIAMFFHAELLR